MHVPVCRCSNVHMHVCTHVCMNVDVASKTLAHSKRRRNSHRSTTIILRAGKMAVANSAAYISYNVDSVHGNKK